MGIGEYGTRGIWDYGNIGKWDYGTWEYGVPCEQQPGQRGLGAC
jgi:hypothetical protein